ncbi:hypothetical protein [Phenylobacterium soli]|uniref:hypothetical protein n=1 Tax=Phenylobacterium soli TaxID=2170551 RepID=UPI001876DEFC|nr:hypothetical protein [Phenylobacterium soli]
MAYSSQERSTLGATRARQGRLGRNIFWVLVFGIALTVLGFAATWAWKAGDLASTQPKNTPAPSEAASFNAPQPGAVSRQNYQKGAPLAPKGGNPQNPPS